jgi:hypothetical protein
VRAVSGRLGIRDGRAETHVTKGDGMPDAPAWKRPGILVGRPVSELEPTERALLLAAVAVLAGRDAEELDAQLALVARAGTRRRSSGRY